MTDRFPVSRPANPRRAATWLTIAALMAQLVLPFDAFAFFRASDGIAVPICTGTGIVWRVIGDDPGVPPSRPDGTRDKCPCCVFHGSPAVGTVAPTVPRVAWRVEGRFRPAAGRGVPARPAITPNPSRAPPFRV